MSSDLQSALELLQMNNNVLLIIVTAIVYDYLLTFSREIDYVWRRPWTWVSTVFVMVRYLGLSSAIFTFLSGGTFLPGPLKFHRCTVLSVLASWEFAIFYNAADLVMILRVYAMWNRSKVIVLVLLLIYVPQVISTLVYIGIYYNPNTYLSVTIVQINNFSVCAFSLRGTSSTLDLYGRILLIVLGAILLVLAVFQTLKQSVAMYKATKKWQPNRYMQQLVRDGVLYFLVAMFFNITSMIQVEPPSNNGLALFLSLLAYITMCPIMPRFIISVRELYDRDIRGRVQGMDTGFGALSQPIASENAVVSAIAFADVTPGDDQIVEVDRNESETIRLETAGDNTCQV